MLELRGVSAFYGNIQALKNVSMTIPPGSMVTIIGANGAGKTTLLKSISGLIQSKSGSICYEGTEISSLPPVKIVSLGISQVPEGRQLFTHLTVLDNLHLGAYLYYSNRTKAEIQKRLDWIYEIFPLLKIRTKQLAGTLSGGEQQMVAIARASCRGPNCSSWMNPPWASPQCSWRKYSESLKF